MVVKIGIPFLGALNIRCRAILGTPKRGHNVDNPPYIRAVGPKDHTVL